MKGKDTYEIYLAVRAAFLSDYDYFKYSGRIKTGADAYYMTKDQAMFPKLGKWYDEDELPYFLAVNFLLHNPEQRWIRDIIKNRESYKREYEQWKKWQEHRMEAFNHELASLKLAIEPESNLDLMLYLLKKIVYTDDPITVIRFSSTAYLFDEAVNLVEEIHKQKCGNYVWDTGLERYKKFKPFFFNYKPVSNILIKNTVRKLWTNT